MYRILMAKSPISEEQLNEMAKEGMWLVTIIQYQGNFYFYFDQLRSLN